MLLPLLVAQPAPPLAVAQPPRMPLVSPAVVVTAAPESAKTSSVPAAVRLMPLRLSIRPGPPLAVVSMELCPALTAVPPSAFWVTIVVPLPKTSSSPPARVRAPLPSLLAVLVM